MMSYRIPQAASAVVYVPRAGGRPCEGLATSSPARTTVMIRPLSPSRIIRGAVPLRKPPAGQAAVSKPSQAAAMSPACEQLEEPIALVPVPDEATQPRKSAAPWQSLVFPLPRQEVPTPVPTTYGVPPIPEVVPTTYGVVGEILQRPGDRPEVIVDYLPTIPEEEDEEEDETEDEVSFQSESMSSESDSGAVTSAVVGWTVAETGVTGGATGSTGELRKELRTARSCVLNFLGTVCPRICCGST
eukprot:TRINITY_DN20244_c0_g1_i3.p2 TRINITY_DN20244_c0_g1~~TRINITY_DN20244_c0_g1_i3.p2  ORF type:complete len:244 (-),score=45.36 TRINITY_DN20244_c0_g1_i3:236-967(-)